jgi:hypothetical protein
MGVGGQRHIPATLPLRMTRYPFYRRLGGSQGISGRVQKISPPLGFDPGNQPVARCCTGYAISARLRVFCTEVESSLTEKLRIVRLCCAHYSLLRISWSFGGYNWWSSSMCSLLQFLVTSSLLDGNFFPQRVCSNTSGCVLHSTWDHVSHPCRTGKIIVLRTNGLVLIFVDCEWECQWFRAEQ